MIYLLFLSMIIFETYEYFLLVKLLIDVMIVILFIWFYWV